MKHASRSLVPMAPHVPTTNSCVDVSLGTGRKGSNLHPRLLGTIDNSPCRSISGTVRARQFFGRNIRRQFHTLWQATRYTEALRLSKTLQLHQLLLQCLRPHWIGRAERQGQCQASEKARQSHRLLQLRRIWFLSAVVQQTCQRMALWQPLGKVPGQST